MRILNQRCCIDFYSLTRKAEPPLKAWITTVRCASWRNFADVRRTYRSADKVGRLLVFNVGGNKYRVLATPNFSFGWVKIERVLTHEEYDRLDVRRL